MMKIVRSLCLSLALAVAPMVIAVCRPLTYLVEKVGGDSQVVRFQRFSLTLSAWRQEAARTATAVGSNMVRQGHGFVMKRHQDDYEGFAPA